MKASYVCEKGATKLFESIRISYNSLHHYNINMFYVFSFIISYNNKCLLKTVILYILI